MSINRTPSRRELFWFGVLLLAFAVALGAVVWWRAGALLGAALILGVAWIISLIFNGEHRKGQLKGAVIPILCLLLGAAVSILGLPAGPVAAVAAILFALLALVVLASPGFARVIYLQWMEAGIPIGWTITRVVLAIVFFLVLTPIGLVMRLRGYDPMQRSFEPEAETYWEEHTPPVDTARYFKQY